MKKGLLVLVLAFAMLITALPVYAASDIATQIDDILSDGNYTKQAVPVKVCELAADITYRRTVELYVRPIDLIKYRNQGGVNAIDEVITSIKNIAKNSVIQTDLKAELLEMFDSTLDDVALQQLDDTLSSARMIGFKTKIGFPVQTYFALPIDPGMLKVYKINTAVDEAFKPIDQVIDKKKQAMITLIDSRSIIIFNMNDEMAAELPQ